MSKSKGIAGTPITIQRAWTHSKSYATTDDSSLQTIVGQRYSSAMRAMNAARVRRDRIAGVAAIRYTDDRTGSSYVWIDLPDSTPQLATP